MTNDTWQTLHFGPPLAPLEIGHFSVQVLCFVLSLSGAACTFKLMGSDKYRTRSYSVYLRWLVLSDAIFMTITTIYKADSILAKVLGRNIYFIDSVLALCAIVVIATNLFQATSGWLVVALSADRFIAVVYPLRQAALCTARQAKIVCLAAVTVCVLYQTGIHSGFIYHAIRSEVCHTVTTRWWHYLALHLTTVTAAIIPIIVVTTMNVKVLFVIKQHGQLRQQISNQEQQANTRATISLVSVCLISVVTMLPMSIYFAVAFFLPQYAIYEIFYPVNMCRMLNFSINFYVLMITGPQYRADMTDIMRGKTPIRS